MPALAAERHQQGDGTMKTRKQSIQPERTELVETLLAACVEGLNALSVAQADAENMGGQHCEEALFFNEPIATLTAAIRKARGK